MLIFLAIVWLPDAALARQPTGLFANSVDRPLRYRPDGGDFVVEDGTANFNRPLYTAHTAGRVEAGDRPEFALCSPSKGGVLRLGVITPRGQKWLMAAAHIVTRYRTGSQIYEIDDPLLGNGKLRLTALPTQRIAGLVLRAQLEGAEGIELVWAYGGGSGESSRTRFDLIDGADPGKTWSLQPEDCAGAAGAIALPNGIKLRTPGDADSKNIAFTSRWNNYPRAVTIGLSGTAGHVYLLMAGSTNPMETQIDNGEVVVAYADGTIARLALRNPGNWRPIEQDYFSDDYAFRRTTPAPMRICLGTGAAYFPSGSTPRPAGGAANVLDLPLDRSKELRSLTVRSLSNEVVIGLMSVTLAR